MTGRAGAHTGPIDQSLPALRRAGLLPPVVIGVVVVLSFTQDPAPSLTGSGLGVSASLAGLVAATTVLVLRVEAPATAIAVAGLIVASACLVWLQPNGAGNAGLFVAVAVAGFRLPDTPSVVALALALAAAVAPDVHAHRSAGMFRRHRAGDRRVLPGSALRTQRRRGARTGEAALAGGSGKPQRGGRSGDAA